MTREPGLDEELRPGLRSHPVLLVLSGPSGVGKDAVVHGVTAQDSRLRFVVTVTDRPRRPEEKDGLDYRFVSSDAFQEMVTRGDLLEHAVVYGQNKGIPKTEVREALSRGEDVLLRVDVQGARTVKSLISEAVTVFLAPPSMQALTARLSGRKTEGGPELERRIATARQEMEALPEFDYRVINRDGRLDEAVRQVLAIVEAERCRTNRPAIRI